MREGQRRSSARSRQGATHLSVGCCLTYPHRLRTLPCETHAPVQTLELAGEWLAALRQLYGDEPLPYMALVGNQPGPPLAGTDQSRRPCSRHGRSGASTALGAAEGGEGPAAAPLAAAAGAEGGQQGAAKGALEAHRAFAAANDIFRCDIGPH